jgi:Xaa-Pro aminopeptidase
MRATLRGMSSSLYVENRRRALAALEARGAAALVFTNRSKTRNHDAEFRFRPDSDFWWLTGFGEPESALVLLPPAEGKPARSVLFLRERNRDAEIWSGRRLGPERACAQLEVDEAHPFTELEKRLPELLKEHSKLVYRAGLDEARDREVFGVVTRLRALARQPSPVPTELLDPALIFHELRLFKSSGELDEMRRAAHHTAAGHLAAMRSARAGMNEREIEALVEYEFRRNGANGCAYTSIVAGGANACILHYVENDQPLRDGDLLLIDAGAESAYYACDITRTFPVNGRFSPEQRALYEVVLQAQLDAIELTRPGTRFDAVHRRALQTLVEGLCRLGLLRGSVEDALKSESYRRFYMHRTSHWLGLDVHDCGAYVVERESRLLEPGMVLTIEPGIYVAEDDDTVDARWRGIGIRIEDDVLVTAADHEVLTAAVPKSLADVERACTR